MCLNSDLFFCCMLWLTRLHSRDMSRVSFRHFTCWSLWGEKNGKRCLKRKKKLFVHPNVGVKWKGWQTGSTVTTALFDLEEERGFLWRTVAIYIVKTVFEVSKLLRIMEISKGICMTTFLRCDTLKLKIRLSHVCRHLSLGPCKLSGL